MSNQEKVFIIICASLTLSTNHLEALLAENKLNILFKLDESVLFTSNEYFHL